jgi:hypothetical protein
MTCFITFDEYLRLNVLNTTCGFAKGCLLIRPKTTHLDWIAPARCHPGRSRTADAVCDNIDFTIALVT